MNDEKQFWSRKEICVLFNKAYTELDNQVHEQEGVECLEELFGLDIYDKDYEIWNNFKDIEYPMEEDRYALAYEKGEWWAVSHGPLLLWKEEVVTLLNNQQDQLDNFEITLKKAICNEKTAMGQSILKQLADKLGVEY